MTDKTYQSPAAFRRALTDRLSTLAKESRWSMPLLQRQVAYDRLLQRLYLLDDGWIVKGATALMARDIGVRGTIDIDLYRNAPRRQAEEDLRRAAALEVGDWFRFTIGPAVTTGGAALAARFRVTSSIGTTTWVEFHIDLVGTEIRMSGEPEHVQPLVPGVIPNAEQHEYRVYPLVDHIADKVAAIYERHGADGYPSTRYRDLVDLVAIVTAVSVDAELQRNALVSEFARRHLLLPATFAVPDQALWEQGYAHEARRSLLRIASTLTDAVDIVGAFLNPLFNATASGTWVPQNLHWQH